MQIICTLLQTDNHSSTSPLRFLQAGCPSCYPTNSIKALKAIAYIVKVVISRKQCKIKMLLLHTTNRQWHMAYQIASFLTTFNGLQNHSLIARLRKCDYCKVVYGNSLMSLSYDSQHLSNGGSMADKREDYQNCSVLCCVRQLCTILCTHAHEQLLQ